MDNLRRIFFSLLISLVVILVIAGYTENELKRIAVTRWRDNKWSTQSTTTTRFAQADCTARNGQINARERSSVMKCGSNYDIPCEDSLDSNGFPCDTAQDHIEKEVIIEETVLPTAKKSSTRDRNMVTAKLPMKSTRRGNSNLRSSSLTPGRRVTRIQGSPVRWQVQYWGGPRFNMKDGVYHCPGLGASVRYTSVEGYDTMRKSDVAILHQMGDWDPEKLARSRRNDQILAYWSLESPMHSNRAEDLSVFNWTMTYRHTSEFPMPYGRLTPFNSSRNGGGEKPKVKENWAEGKTKLAAWIASNCHWLAWRRTDFVRTLQQYMDIDTFGKCGRMTCHDCVKQLDAYKFYLSFENDQCEDYITEKVWRNGFVHGTVPVVFGANRSNFEKFVPKDSFIHVNDFANISSLVAYIKEVDRNNSLYNKFFHWRKDFYVEDIHEYEHLNVEKVCAIVKRYEQSPNEKYVDKTKWFHGSCHKSPLPHFV